jgi:hypothetical protein
MLTEKDITGVPILAVLNNRHELAQMYKEKPHRIGHEGKTSPLHMQIKAGGADHRPKKAATSVKKKCTECQLRMRACLEQKMGPLLNHWVKPGPAFQ